MDRGYASQLQAFSKATLLGLVLFSMVTWVPHGLSCVRGFLFVSLPSVASAITMPKCLFLFSNIIVLFLATQLTLSQNNGAQSPSCEDNIDVVVRELVVFPPSFKENHPVEEEEHTVNGSAIGISTHQLDQFEKENALSTTLGVQEMIEEGDTSLVNYVGDGRRMHVEDEVLLEEVMEEEGCEEEVKELPTDELNRRVEDFIARFNMERQLEARMIMCCC